MKKAKDILKDLISNLEKTVIEKGNTYTKIAHSWEKIVGERLKDLAAIDEIKNQILFIKVSHPGAKQLVLLKKNEIIDKINEMFKDAKINEIVIK